MKKPVKLVKKNFELHVNYDDNAIEKKLMKFITPSGDEFTISADEMSTILIGQVNSEQLEATFVESERVNVVEVTRQIAAIADRDIKKGESIRLEYTHPYPIEFAIIEEGMKIAKINKNAKVTELTAEFLQQVKEKITPEQTKFITKFYEFFKNLFKGKAST